MEGTKMPSLQFSNNLWVTYYDDDTEEKGYYIDEIYNGMDSTRTNMADWFSDSAIAFIDKKIEDDIYIRKAWA